MKKKTKTKTKTTKTKTNKQKKNDKSKCFYKRLHNDTNVLRFKKCLSQVKREEIFDNVNAEDDYNKFIKKFQDLYDECIPLKMY